MPEVVATCSSRSVKSYRDAISYFFCQAAASATTHLHLHFPDDIYSTTIKITTTIMASPNDGRRRKGPGKSKDNLKSLKRKRDVDDLEKLDKAVEELVSKTNIYNHEMLM